MVAHLLHAPQVPRRTAPASPAGLGPAGLGPAGPAGPGAPGPVGDPASLLHLLTDAQRAAVTSVATPLCVLAGAGSGKTKVLTHRIAYRAAVGTADPARALALTFTRKAAAQLRARLGRLGLGTPVAAGTFHAVAFAQLRQIWADRGQRPPALLERRARLLGPLVAGGTGSSHHRAVAQVAAEIAWAKTRDIGPRSYASAAMEAGRRPALSPDSIAEVFDRYEIEKRRRGLLDLDDVLLRCAQAIENDPETAATQRWRWRHLFVDEYQDLNPAHARLIDAWLGTSLDLCVVGDPHQAIYEWNGSDPSLLTGFPRRYPSAEMVTLSDNFRSSAAIVAVAGAALDAPVPVALEGDGPVPVVRAYDSDAEEAAGIAQATRDLHAPGTAWSRLAVLARTNAQLVIIGAAMAAAGVPHRIHGGRPLALHPAMADLLAGPGDRPARSLEGEFRLLLAGEARDVRHVDIERPGEGGASRWATPPGAHLQQVRAWQAGLRALREYLDLDRLGTIAGFVGWLASSDLSWEDAAGDAVALSTFHRAKGLEWPIVFVAGLEDGLVPLTRAANSPPAAEERRLLYVALTRAGTELRCSWARRRRFGARVVDRSPSPFLPAIEDAITALTAERRTVDPRPALRTLRQTLASGRPGTSPGLSGGHDVARQLAEHHGATTNDAPTTNADLFDDLWRWRDTVARANRVAPTAVIGDRTLAAAATCPPRDQEDLVALPGLGPVTATRWGPDLLAVVARHTPRPAAHGAPDGTPD